MLLGLTPSSFLFRMSSSIRCWFPIYHPAPNISHGATNLRFLRKHHRQHPVPGGVLSCWKRRLVWNRDRLQPSHMLRRRCVELAGAAVLAQLLPRAGGGACAVLLESVHESHLPAAHATCTFSIKYWSIPASSNVALHSWPAPVSAISDG